MKKLISKMMLILTALFAVGSLSAQEVQWSASIEEQSADGCRVVVTANIPEGYHMYDLGPYVGGPLATALTFTIEGGETVGEVTPLQDAHRYYDDVFCMEIGTYEGVAKFAQEIRLNAPAVTIAITTESMICDDQSCMPPQDSELKLTIGEPTEAGVSYRIEYSELMGDDGDIWPITTAHCPTSTYTLSGGEDHFQ
ncbi:MAG: hypothetical protein IIX12_01615, partial [Alistipes sp.]|nr:hypothetical protein [Alistipes sp.]